MGTGWVETMVITKPNSIPVIRNAYNGWVCILNQPYVRFWINSNDLKDEFEFMAAEDFGDNLIDIIRLSNDGNLTECSKY